MAAKGINGLDHYRVPIPFEEIGDWVSIDRLEIEGVRSIRNILTEYIKSPERASTLSLAVFGPPGAGKSFAIKQIIKKDCPDGATFLEFNLSQFRSAEELPGAFQYIRDSGLERKLPVVFWDEFDGHLNGNEFGWLPYFLAPMQDAKFFEAGIPRPLGRAVFIFAGGTVTKMANFRTRLENRRWAWRFARHNVVLKGTDFLSRLRGYLDVLGPNDDAGDRDALKLRRALLLNSLLRKRVKSLCWNGEFHIDRALLDAFLNIRNYTHGARSMEAIIEMSSLAEKLTFAPSVLPDRKQLQSHVDADEFWRLIVEAIARSDRIRVAH